MRLPSSSAAKRSAEQKADFVPGHKSGEFLEGGILEDAARVGGGLAEDCEGKVAVFGSGIRVHGLLSFERFGSYWWRVEGRREAVRHIKAGIS
jgi:hypothetical protein